MLDVILAATMIQSVFRGYLERKIKKQVERRRVEHKASSVRRLLLLKECKRAGSKLLDSLDTYAIPDPRPLSIRPYQDASSG